MPGIEICEKTEKHLVLVSLSINSLNRKNGMTTFRHVLQQETPTDEEKKQVSNDAR